MFDIFVGRGNETDRNQDKEVDTTNNHGMFQSYFFLKRCIKL